MRRKCVRGQGGNLGNALKMTVCVSAACYVLTKKKGKKGRKSRSVVENSDNVLAQLCQSAEIHSLRFENNKVGDQNIVDNYRIVSAVQIIVMQNARAGNRTFRANMSWIRAILANAKRVINLSINYDCPMDEE